MNKRICVVAIVKNEEPFLDEWLIYHRLIGVDHFFIYDDDPELPLKNFFKPHSSYLTIVDWYGKDKDLPGRNNQTKAYWHAVENYITDYEWVAFIDGDEFIVLPAWDDQIYKFLDEFEDAGAISLNWHVFGHNGHYETPEGLITAALTRRMKKPNTNVKTITRTKNIKSINTAHFCRIDSGLWFDANHKMYNDSLYEGKTSKGYINHYQCRSFKHWMARCERGDVNFSGKDTPDEQIWRCYSDLLLKKFVENVAYNKNEHVDEYMIKFTFAIQKQILQLNNYQSFVSLITPSVDDKLSHHLTTLTDFIATQIMLNIDDVGDNYTYADKGLIINYLLNYARFRSNKACKQAGLNILEKMWSEIDINTPINYRYGITGLGIMFECLAQNCLLEGNTDELLEDVDTLLQYHFITNSVSRIEAFTGEAGIGKYFLSRMQNGFRAPGHPKNNLIKGILTDMMNLPANEQEEGLPHLLQIINMIGDIYKYLDEKEKVKIKEYSNDIVRKISLSINEKNKTGFLIQEALNAAIIMYKAGKVFSKSGATNLAEKILYNYEEDYLKHGGHNPLIIWLNYYALSSITKSEINKQKALYWLRKGVVNYITRYDVNNTDAIAASEVNTLVYNGLLMLYALDERVASSVNIYNYNMYANSNNN